MVSIIVISLNGNTKDIEKELAKQTFKDFELVKIFGEKPASRARNKGVEEAQGDIVVFVDDDMLFGSEKDLEKMVAFVEKADSSFGAVGSGLLLPKDANWFEKRIAKEISRVEIKAPSKNEMAADRLTGVFFAMKKDVYEKLGGLDNGIASGSDREFFYRLKEKGYDNYFLKDIFVYHHPPQNIKSLLKKYFWYGIGHFQAGVKHPKWKIGPNLNKWYKLFAYVVFRTLYLSLHVFVDTDFSSKKIRLGFYPLRAASSYAALLGYIKGYLSRSR